MIKIIVSVAAAIALGVLLMLMPIMVYTSNLVSTEVTSQWLGEQSDRGLPTGENASTLKLAEGLDTFEAAQTYGTMDAGPSPFPSSLFHMLLVAATGMVAAIGVSMFLKRKMKPF